MPITSEKHDAILLKNIQVIDEHSPYHLQRSDILILEGNIESIGEIESEGAYTIDGSELSISPGWFDYGIYGGTPGLELIERKSSILQAACAGGYTRIALWPEAIPYTDHASSVKQIQGKDPQSGLSVHVIGGLSKSGKGEELAEILNMRDAGIVAISDGHTHAPGSNILKKALQYCQPLGFPVIVKPVDPELSHGNHIHEGELSTRLGLKGDPSIGELSTVNQQLNLAEYTEGNILLHLLSSEKSIQLIKNTSRPVSASVSVLHLCHTEEDLAGYNSLYKLEPPLRSLEDKKALRKAVAEKTIQSIVSDHRPRDLESWKVEYARASTGQSTIELSYAICQSSADDILNTEHIVHALSHGNRAALGINTPVIQENEPAEFTLFNPKQKWIVNELYSDGKNSSYVGKELTGKACLTIIKDSVNFIN